MIYIVTETATGNEVYRYQADAPIEWNGMEFATHDHAEQPVVNEDGSIEGQVIGRVFTKLEYLRLFTSAERIAIRDAAKQSPELEDYLEMLKLSDEINTGDPDTIAAVTMLELVGLIAAGRAQEVLNG